MADVLSVIADIIKQDKQQKREHNKIMREVKKKMKEAEVSEEEGDQGDYSAFVQKKLKKYGVSSPAELTGNGKVKTKNQNQKTNKQILVQELKKE